MYFPNSTLLINSTNYHWTPNLTKTFVQEAHDLNVVKQMYREELLKYLEESYDVPWEHTGSNTKERMSSKEILKSLAKRSLLTTFLLHIDFINESHHNYYILSSE